MPHKRMDRYLEHKVNFITRCSAKSGRYKTRKSTLPRDIIIPTL